LDSDEDYEDVIRFTWVAIKSRRKSAPDVWYAAKAITRTLMHRWILGKKCISKLVDHKDRDGLNNQRNNIRIATRSQNAANRTATGNSKYLGVSYSPRCTMNDKWIASCAGKPLGIFNSEIEAAKAYNKEARKKFGCFANINRFLK